MSHNVKQQRSKKKQVIVKKPPTFKQKRAAMLIVENHLSSKPITLGKILIQAGYSHSVATHPSQVLRSPTFIQILEDAGITDYKIADVMREGLAASKKGEADHNTRHKFLDTALRVKGKLTPTSEPVNTSDTYNTFIQNNNINTIEAKELAAQTLKIMMDQTKPKRPIDNVNSV